MSHRSAGLTREGRSRYVVVAGNALAETPDCLALLDLVLARGTDVNARGYPDNNEGGSARAGGSDEGVEHHRMSGAVRHAGRSLRRQVRGRCQEVSGADELRRVLNRCLNTT